jgi:hypothetical protein
LRKIIHITGKKWIIVDQVRSFRITLLLIIYLLTGGMLLLCAKKLLLVVGTGAGLK